MELRNRFVMCPLTRNRATMDLVPTDREAETSMLVYYEQRATHAGKQASSCPSGFPTAVVGSGLFGCGATSGVVQDSVQRPLYSGRYRWGHALHAEPRCSQIVVLTLTYPKVVRQTTTRNALPGPASDFAASSATVPMVNTSTRILFAST